jgi:hypothetical protein
VLLTVPLSQAINAYISIFETFTISSEFLTEVNMKENLLFPTLFGSSYLYCCQTSIYCGPKQPPQQLGRRGGNNISGGAVGINLNEAPHVNKDSTPLCTFMVFLTGIIHLLVEETNRYYHQYLDSLEDSTPLPDMTDSEKLLSLGVIIQMGHEIRDRLRYYWTTAEQLLTSFYSNTLQRDPFFYYILRFLHFTDKPTVMTDYGKLGVYLTHSTRIGEASTQRASNVTWDCALLGASRSTTQRRDLVR